MPGIAFLKKTAARYKLEIAGMIAGAIGGWCYWYFAGCASGQCIITSRPFNSTAYGAVMGSLLFSMFKTGSKK